MKIRKKGLFTVVLVLLLLVINSSSVFASYTQDAGESIDTEKNGSARIEYKYDEAKIADLQVSLYRVADVNENFIYTVVSDFDGYDLDFNQVKSDSEWEGKIKSIEKILNQKNITPYAGESTGADGAVTFENLKPGLYLAESAEKKTENGKYIFEAALVAVPGLDSQGTLLYDVTCYPKGSFKKSEIPSTTAPPTTTSPGEHNPTPGVKTGDSSDSAFWIIIAGAAFMVIIVVLILDRRRKTR